MEHETVDADFDFRGNTAIDLGVCSQGIHNKVHILEGTMYVDRRYDAEPHLDYARRGREAQAGKGWGEGRHIGHIPGAVLGQALMIQDNDERERFIMNWLREHKQFQMFERAFIVPTTYRSKTTPGPQAVA